MNQLNAHVFFGTDPGSVPIIAGTGLYTADLSDLALNDPPRAYPRPNVPPKNPAVGDQEAFLRFSEPVF
jgi:hypothetical protein